jgi:hypothetical protein
MEHRLLPGADHLHLTYQAALGQRPGQEAQQHGKVHAQIVGKERPTIVPWEAGGRVPGLGTDRCREPAVGVRSRDPQAAECPFGPLQQPKGRASTTLA